MFRLSYKLITLIALGLSLSACPDPAPPKPSSEQRQVPRQVKLQVLRQVKLRVLKQVKLRGLRQVKWRGQKQEKWLEKWLCLLTWDKAAKMQAYAESMKVVCMENVVLTSVLMYTA